MGFLLLIPSERHYCCASRQEHPRERAWLVTTSPGQESTGHKYLKAGQDPVEQPKRLIFHLAWRKNIFFKTIEFSLVFKTLLFKLHIRFLCDYGIILQLSLSLLFAFNVNPIFFPMSDSSLRNTFQPGQCLCIYYVS